MTMLLLPPPYRSSVSRRISILASAGLVAAILACSIYANLSFAVRNQADYKYFPPFRPFVDANTNHHLGAEYFNIAKAIVGGEGFANPFGERTGPTAWMPPVLPTILAGLLWACDGNRDLVMAIFIFLQVLVLIATGILVLALVGQTTNRLGTWVAAVIFLVAILGDFHLWFQFTHDCWLVLLALNILIVGFCWFEPLHSKKAAATWGLCGGLLAMVNPIVAFAWGILSLVVTIRHRSWSRLTLAVLTAMLTLAPWTIRNYLVFGRLIPVKSNLDYELYQSQCLLPDGLLQPRAFSVHPYVSRGRERQEYKRVGEMAFLDQKRELFWRSVRADPLDFADRVASRILGATLWYTPFNRAEEARRPWILWWGRLTHPLPFLSLVILAFTAIRERLHWYQWLVMGVYVLYLLPYVVVSYYDRYTLPLLGVKALLVVWAADRVLSLFHTREGEKEKQEVGFLDVDGPADAIVVCE